MRDPQRGLCHRRLGTSDPTWGLKEPPACFPSSDEPERLEPPTSAISTPIKSRLYQGVAVVGIAPLPIGPPVTSSLSVAVLVKTVPFHAPCAKRPATSRAMRG